MHLVVLMVLNRAGMVRVQSVLLELMVSMVMRPHVFITVVDDVGIVQGLVVHGQGLPAKLHQGMWVVGGCHFSQLRLVLLL